MNKYFLIALLFVSVDHFLLPACSKPSIDKAEYNSNLFGSYTLYEWKRDRRKRPKKGMSIPIDPCSTIEGVLLFGTQCAGGPNPGALGGFNPQGQGNVFGDTSPTTGGDVSGGTTNSGSVIAPTCPIKNTDFIPFFSPGYTLTTSVFINRIDTYDIVISGQDGKGAIRYSAVHKESKKGITDVWTDVNFDQVTFILPEVSPDSFGIVALNTTSCTGKLQNDQSIRGTCQTLTIGQNDTVIVTGGDFVAVPR